MAQLLNNLTDDADQVMAMTLPDGSNLKLEFVFRPAVQRWMLNVTHDQIILQGFYLTLSPNVLRPWKNVLTFGLAITAVDALDPIEATAFSSGRVSAYVLTAEEVQQVEDEILIPVPLVNP